MSGYTHPTTVLAFEAIYREEYDRELASCDRWIKWCEDQNDTHGSNFHRGLRSAHIFNNIKMEQLLRVLKQIEPNTVCDRWRNDYHAFLRDAGERPSVNHSIDRINNYGNYEPGNVRWATGRVQSNNRRTNRLVTVSGKTASVTVMARAYGISSTAVFGRLDSGWNVELAFTAPVSKATNPTGINGGTKKRKPRAAAAQPSETPAIGRADGATER